MGFGKLNPGCECACTTDPPLDDCQAAGAELRPISLTLHCPSYDLGTSALDCEGEIGGVVNARPKFIPNPRTVTYYFPSYSSPDFSCSVGVRSDAGPVGELGITGTSGYWIVSENADCFFALTNMTEWYPVNFFGYHPLTFFARMSFGRDFANNLLMSIELSAFALIAAGIRQPEPPRVEPCGFFFPDLPLHGNNYAWSPVYGAVEINQPPCRTLSFRRWQALQETIWGGLCLHGINEDLYVTQISSINMYTSYLVNFSDPSCRDKRTFDMWVPDPAADDVGIIDGVQAVVELGIDT